MYPFKYKDGSEPKYGDVVAFHVWDSDDFVSLRFICILSTNHFIYFCGGMDCGMAAGKIITFEEAIEYSNDNEPSFVGFEKIGSHYQINQSVAKGFGI